MMVESLFQKRMGNRRYDEAQPGLGDWWVESLFQKRTGNRRYDDAQPPGMRFSDPASRLRAACIIHNEAVNAVLAEERTSTFEHSIWSLTNKTYQAQATGKTSHNCSEHEVSNAMHIKPVSKEKTGAWGVSTRTWHDHPPATAAVQSFVEHQWHPSHHFLSCTVHYNE
jgi:hypothetical protein